MSSDLLYFIQSYTENGTHNPLVPGSSPGCPIFFYSFAVGLKPILTLNLNDREDGKIKVYVFRYSPIPVESVLKTVSELEKITTYRRFASPQEAPDATDCLTSIHYIFKQTLSIDIPMTYIGDLPRKFLSFDRWRALKIDLKDAQCGDILFVKNKKTKKLLSHAALFVGVDKIFHCYASLGKATTESSDQFFSLYEQKLCFKKMIRYIDQRNTKLRAIHGIFIQD